MKWPEAEYKNLQQQKETGTPLDDLFELFATEASLLSTTEQINHSDRHACELLLQDCLSHRERIMRWYSQNELYIGGPPIFCEPGETPCPRLPPAEDLFGVPYQFNTPDHARLHVLYWTALTMVQSLIYQARVLVLAHFNPADTFPVNPRAHGDYLLSEHYAGEICRAVPYCLQPKMKLAGARIILPTMPHIYKPYMHLRDEKRFTWCQKVSSLLADLGFHMAEQLHRTASRYWSLSEDPNTNSILSLSLRWEISEDENSAPVSTPGKNNEAWGVTQTTEVHGRSTTVENSQNTTGP